MKKYYQAIYQSCVSGTRCGVFQYSGSFNNGSSDRICKDWNGCACVIQEFVQEELDRGDLITLPLGLTFSPRQIGFACRKHEQANPVIQHFLDLRGNILP